MTIASASISTFQRGRAARRQRPSWRRGGSRRKFAVDGADGLGVGGVGQQHAGADDVGQRGSGLCQRRLDDREAAAGLEGDVVGARAVGEDGRGAGDEDPVADADRARRSRSWARRGSRRRRGCGGSRRQSRGRRPGEHVDYCSTGHVRWPRWGGAGWPDRVGLLRRRRGELGLVQARGRRRRRPAAPSCVPCSTIRPCLHHEDQVGVADRREPVRDDEAGAVAAQRGHRVLDEHLGAGVDRAGGLVEDQQRGVGQERAGDRDQLLLAGADVAASSSITVS